MEILQVVKMLKSEGFKTSLQSLRVYEKQGLIPSMKRAPGEWRDYTDIELAYLRGALTLREIGLSIQEIKELIDFIHHTGNVSFKEMGSDKCKLSFSIPQDELGEFSLKSTLIGVSEKAEIWIKIFKKLSQRIKRLQSITEIFQGLDELIGRMEALLKKNA
jgi:DNA-binding transcriptional MerR regulator